MSQEQTTSFKGNILVVDDTPADFQCLTRMLSVAGYQVQKALSSQVALKSVLATPPDLILLDIMMPDKDGYEICSELKASSTTQDIPVIFMSALPEALDKRRAFAVGGADYIIQPFLMEEVLARVEHQLAICRLSRQLAEQKDITARQKTEAALRESEERWQLAIAANNEGIWDFNLKSGKTFRSPRWKQMLGYEDHEIGEAPEEWSNLIHPEDRDQVMSVTRDFHARKIPHFAVEYRMRCKDGSYKWILSRAQALWGEDGKPVRVVGSNADITERKLSEEKLRQSEAFLATAQRIAHVGSWEFDVLREKNTWSAETFRIFGLNSTEPEPTFAELLEMVHPDDRTVFQQNVSRALAKGIPYDFDFRIMRPDGSIRYLEGKGEAIANNSGQIIRLFGSVLDITERKQAEAALAESEQKYRNLVETSQDLIWSVDTEGRLTFINPAVKQIYGYSPEEVIGRYFSDFVSPEQLAQDVNAFQRIFKGEPLLGYETTHLAKDGRRIYLLFNATPEWDEKGNIIGTTGTASDITARKLAEAEIIRAKDLLESIFNASADALFLVNHETGLIADCNRRAMELFEVSSKDELLNVEGNTLQKKSFTAEELNSIFAELELQGFWSREIEYVSKKGKTFWGNLAATRIQIAGQKMNLVRVTDITERKQREEALRLIVEGTASATGNCFMRSCVRYLAQALQVRYAIITEWADENKTEYSFTPYPQKTLATSRVRTLAFWTGETWSDNFEYNLAGTPCEIVLSGATCYYPQDVQAFFPSDQDLVQLNAQSYLGIPLIDSNGTIIGHLAVLDTKAMSYNPGTESILKIFAARAAAELERQQAEFALQESQCRYQTLAEASPACIFHTDASGNCRYVNQRWRKITGLSPEKALATGWISPLHPKDRDRVLAEWDEAAATKSSFKSEYRFLRPDGQTIWVISQALPEFGEDGALKGFIGTITDISDAYRQATQRKRAEAALRQQLKREQLVKAIQERIRSSLNLEAVLNTTVEEVREFLQTDRTIIYRFRPDWSGDVVVESVGEGWMKTIGENIHDPCFGTRMVMPYQQGRISTIEDINTAGLQQCFTDLLKYYQVRADIVVPILLQSGDKSRVEGAVGEHKHKENDFTSPLPSLWGLLIVHHCCSPRQWLESEIESLRQISVQLAIAIQQSTLFAQAQAEIAERKRAEAALEKAKEAAEVANCAKSEFLANMSHELRTPLNAILGFTQLMHRTGSLSVEQQSHLDIILRSGEHLLSLINDILEMSKIEAGRVSVNESTFDLYRLLDTLEEMLQLKATSKGLQLQFERSFNVPQYIRTDEGKLRQILINLLGNAIKFTEVGHVALTIKKSPDLGEISHQSSVQKLEATSSNNCHLVLSVRDTGPGIAQEEIDSLFEAFSQTASGRQSQQGTGLGLPISRSFLQLMGGDITVHSRVGQGTTFTFDIPVKLAQASDLQTSQTLSRVIGLAPEQREYRILVAEDKPDSRQLLVKLLNSVGFKVREACNGEEAVALWLSWQPHLIWMDMRMPIMDGYEATQQIKSHLNGQATVIIALTASAFEEQRAMILSAGCDDFVRKPFREEVLFLKMAEHLGVCYIYEEQTLQAESDERTECLQPAAFVGMPKDWIEQLHQSAEACWEEELIALIEQIPDTQVALKSALAGLVDNFRFDIIIDLTQRILNLEV